MASDPVYPLARAVARLRLVGAQSNGDDVVKALEEVAEAAEELCIAKGVLPEVDEDDE